MGTRLDPTGILGVIVIIAGAQVVKAYPTSGVLQPPGPLDPTGTYRKQLQPTADTDHRRAGRDVNLDGLKPTGIFALDPNPNPPPGITIYPVGKDGGPDASRPTYIQPDGTVIPDPINTNHADIIRSSRNLVVFQPTGPLDPTGTYRKQLQPTANTNHRRAGRDVNLDGLKPTGIFKRDPNWDPNSNSGITTYPVGKNGLPDTSSPAYVQPDGTVTPDPNPTYGITFTIPPEGHNRQLQLTGIFALDANPTPTPRIGIRTAGRTKRDARPYSTFVPDGRPAIEDGIYPAGGNTFGSPAIQDGIYPASGNSFSQPAIPDGIYPAGGNTFSQPANTFSQPTNTFSQPANAFSQPPNTFSQPANTFSQPANTFSQPAIPDGIYPAGGNTFSQPANTFSQPANTFGPPAIPAGIYPPAGRNTFNRPLRPTGIFTAGGRTHSQPLRPTGIFTAG